MTSTDAHTHAGTHLANSLTGVSKPCRHDRLVSRSNLPSGDLLLHGGDLGKPRTVILLRGPHITEAALDCTEGFVDLLDVVHDARQLLTQLSARAQTFTADLKGTHAHPHTHTMHAGAAHELEVLSLITNAGTRRLPRACAYVHMKAHVHTHTTHPAAQAAYLALELDAAPYVVRNAASSSPHGALGVFLETNKHTLTKVGVSTIHEGLRGEVRAVLRQPLFVVKKDCKRVGANLLEARFMAVAENGCELLLHKLINRVSFRVRSGVFEERADQRELVRLLRATSYLVRKVVVCTVFSPLEVPLCGVAMQKKSTAQTVLRPHRHRSTHIHKLCRVTGTHRCHGHARTQCRTLTCHTVVLKVAARAYAQTRTCICTRACTQPHTLTCYGHAVTDMHT